ncbi:hypothetical protein AAVH_25869 [Aphelenchoides avenae]|nr:hypothetical protein AAVH_25869 [Aphelenchus avenae]
MESPADKVRAKRGRTEIHDMTQISHDTMLEVLLWLDRFDLDGKQITSRGLRSLVENNRMPLRKVFKVDYDEANREDTKTNILNIHLQDPDDDEPPQVELQIDTYADAQKAASYLASCFVLRLSVYRHFSGPPRNVILAAPALIRKLHLRHCDFSSEEENTLNKTLSGSTFQCLSVYFSDIPAWQINDDLLESLRLRGCNETEVSPYAGEKFHVTEQGILRYCFMLDDDSAKPKTRVLRLTWTKVTPTFFRELVDAIKDSRLTSDVKLCLEHLRFDVTNLDVGVTPSRGREYDRFWKKYLNTVRYDIADHGNGMRLLINFKSGMDDQDWKATVRYGQKDHEEFFEPKEDD